MHVYGERERESHVLAMSFIVLRGIVCQLIHIVFSCPVSMEVQSNNYHRRSQKYNSLIRIGGFLILSAGKGEVLQ